MSSTTTPVKGATRARTLSFRGLDHLGYYRLTDDQRNDYDVTGCGNSVDTSEPGVLRMVDGFASLLGGQRWASTASASTW